MKKTVFVSVVMLLMVIGIIGAQAKTKKPIVEQKVEQVVCISSITDTHWDPGMYIKR